MTNQELAELRGEIFGLKVLLFNALAEIAATKPNLSAHLETLRTESLEGIMAADHSKILPAHLPKFRSAAAGIVVQALDAVPTARAVRLLSRLQ